jgi:hypothetical protein
LRNTDLSIDEETVFEWFVVAVRTSDYIDIEYLFSEIARTASSCPLNF